MKFASWMGVLVVGALGAAIACGGKKPPPPVVAIPTAEPADMDAGTDAPVIPKSLYERLGSREGITKVVDSFVATITQDPALKKSFAKTTGAKLEHFKKALVDQLCEATGGDAKYAGKTMKDAHRGMKITEPQWLALVEDLKAALAEAKVGEAEVTDLFAIVGPMHGDIVEAKPAAKK
jgi:hemoglobin